MRILRWLPNGEATANEVAPGAGNGNAPLRTYIPIGNEPEQTVASGSKATASADVKITTPLDVNNMVAVEFTVFPGLYPTIGGKLIKRGPFKSKAEMYESLDSDAERAALKPYDRNIRIKERDLDLYQYKNAGIYV